MVYELFSNDVNCAANQYTMYLLLFDYTLKIDFRKMPPKTCIARSIN